MFKSIFSSSTVSSIEISSLFISLFASLVLGFLIALTHKYTSKYSKNFLITITLLPFLVECVMVMVNGSLGTSIAIMGAFSLVRFRSLPGTSKEILTVFFAMTIGLATGMGQIYFAIITTIMGIIMIVLLDRVKLFSKDNSEKLLKVVVPEDLNYNEVFNDILSKYTSSYELIRSKTINLGSMFELTYTLRLKSKINDKELIDEIRSRNSNLKVVLESSEGEYDL